MAVRGCDSEDGFCTAALSAVSCKTSRCRCCSACRCHRRRTERGTRRRRSCLGRRSCSCKRPRSPPRRAGAGRSKLRRACTSMDLHTRRARRCKLTAGRRSRSACWLRNRCCFPRRTSCRRSPSRCRRRCLRNSCHLSTCPPCPRNLRLPSTCPRCRQNWPLQSSHRPNWHPQRPRLRYCPRRYSPRCKGPRSSGVPRSCKSLHTPRTPCSPRCAGTAQLLQTHRRQPDPLGHPLRRYPSGNRDRWRRYRQQKRGKQIRRVYALHHK